MFRLGAASISISSAQFPVRICVLVLKRLTICHSWTLMLVQVGWETLRDEFTKMLEQDCHQKGHDGIFDDLKFAVKDASLELHKWDEKAQESLVSRELFVWLANYLWFGSSLLPQRVIQMNMLEDRSVHNKNQWDAAIKFMDAAVRERLATSRSSWYELL